MGFNFVKVSMLTKKLSLKVSNSTVLCKQCTLRGHDQSLKCAFISIFYGAVLYICPISGKYRTLGQI